MAEPLITKTPSCTAYTGVCKIVCPACLVCLACLCFCVPFFRMPFFGVLFSWFTFLRCALFLRLFVFFGDLFIFCPAFFQHGLFRLVFLFFDVPFFRCALFFGIFFSAYLFLSVLLSLCGFF